ncbi:MAG: UDP-3-O-acyl-N-acetylglucosamine deacetylase [Nitrospirae bacterium]|nr:UDP-3-O-acyl-N-acetylglucosamine deacetylase [Nitrospirota bacterium]
MRLQRTIKKEASFCGIGLHTGRHATVRLKPASRDTGLVFYRTDKRALIRANTSSVLDTSFATTIGYEGAKIKTVEHLLAAITGLGIDNLLIEVDGPEIPILDGSSTELTCLILDAGIAKQGRKMPHLVITKPIMYRDTHSSIMAFPFDGTRISYSINFDHHIVGRQEMTIDLNEESFVKEIAPARTFGFLRDVEMLKANGLAKGGSLDNAVVVGDDGILNSSGLRFCDEFVRHKILDTIGDISLLGFPIRGHLLLEKAGHTANLRFMKKLLSSIDCFNLISEVDLSSQQVLNYS